MDRIKEHKKILWYHEMVYRDSLDLADQLVELAYGSQKYAASFQKMNAPQKSEILFYGFIHKF